MARAFFFFSFRSGASVWRHALLYLSARKYIAQQAWESAKFEQNSVRYRISALFIHFVAVVSPKYWNFELLKKGGGSLLPFSNKFFGHPGLRHSHSDGPATVSIYGHKIPLLFLIRLSRNRPDWESISVFKLFNSSPKESSLFFKVICLFCLLFLLLWRTCWPVLCMCVCL